MISAKLKIGIRVEIVKLSITLVLKILGIYSCTYVKYCERRLFPLRLFFKFIIVDMLVVTKSERSMSITIK